MYSSLSVGRKGSFGKSVSGYGNTVRRFSLSTLKGRVTLSSKELIDLNVLSKSVGNKQKQKAIVKFGLPLAESVDDGREIPLFVLKATSFLEANALKTEAIFFFENPQHLQSLELMLEKGETDVQDIKVLWRLLVADLDSCRITETYDDFISTIDIEETEFYTQALRSLVYRLPKSHRILLQYLLAFLKKVASNAEFNLMPMSKIAKVFGPVLLRSKHIYTDSAVQQTVQCPLIIERLMSNYDVIFLVTEDPETRYTIKDSIPIVKISSIDSALRKLLDDFNPDSDFKDIFLFTHPYFIESVELLKKLLSLYAQFQENVTSIHFAKLRIRIIKLIKYWIKNYTSEIYPHSQEFASHLKQFVETSKDSTNQVEVFKPILKLIGTIEPTACDQNNSFQATGFQILDYQPQDLAKQMTLFEHNLLMKVDMKEAILKRFTQPQESPTFNELTTQFNEFVQWVATEILKRENLEKRTEVLTHFIKIAEHCRDLKNYQTSAAIISALNLSSIARLKLTWAKLSKSTVVKYTKLMDLFSITKNFKNYRDEVAKCQPPLIPYFPLCPKYLTGIEETQPNFLEGLINFGKMRLIYSVVKEINNFKSGSYDCVKVTKIYDSLKTLQLLDENSLFNLSLKYEPKDPEKEVVHANPLLNHKKRNLDKSSRRSSGSDEESIETQLARRLEEEEETKEKLTEKHLANLDTLLTLPEATELFSAYLESINSKHLLDFLIEVGQFRETEEPIYLQELANSIYKTYLESKKIVADESSLLQVNSVITPNSFDYIAASVYLALNELLPSFTQSPIVKKALEAK